MTSPNIKQHFFYDEILSLGGKVYEIQSWKKIGITKYFSQWKSLLLNYEIVHAHMGLESGIPLFFAWLNDVPIRIAHARDSGVYDISTLKKFYLTVIKKMTYFFSTDKIYCSKEAAIYAFGQKNLNKKHFYFLPNAIDLNLFKIIDMTAKQKIIEEFNFGQYDYILGTVGNGRTVKNHIFLVKIFYEFLKLSPNSVLLIVGDNEQDVEAKKYIKNTNIENNVIFTGVRKDIPNILQILDLFILPSLTEGAPGSVIEAQAANVPCILSDTITHSVDVGTGIIKYLSLNKSEEFWANEMLQSCQMKRPNYGITIMQLQKSGYDIDSSLNKLLEIYRIN